jgi:RNA polymerase sigma factor (sigma-70 family)
MSTADAGSTRPSQLKAIRDWQNHQGWIDFQRRYDPLLRACCASLRLDGPTTDEVCQSTWIEVARRIKSFEYDPKKSFRGWLRTVCANKARDCFRKAKNHLVLPFEERDDAIRAGQFRSWRREAPDFDCDQDEDPIISLWKRRAEEIQTAVKAKVQPQTWDAFWLLRVRDWNLEETVEALGISHASAYKAKERVARQLKDEGRRRYGSSFEPGS